MFFSNVLKEACANRSAVCVDRTALQAGRDAAVYSQHSLPDGLIRMQGYTRPLELQLDNPGALFLSATEHLVSVS